MNRGDERAISADRETGVIYLLTGAAHGPRMVVSLRSLREHYAGPVTLYTTQPASHEIGERCANDERLRVEHRRFPQVGGGKNSSFLTKIALLSSRPHPITLYLDADTLIVGPIDELFELEPDEDFGVAQFANWRTTERVIRKRIDAWKSVRANRFDAVRLSALVQDALADRPAVNGGVVAFRTDRDSLRHWRDLSLEGRNTFICDEIALQMLTTRYRHRLFDCRFNCSPVRANGTEDVRVWHFHGERHVRSAQCRSIWLPAFHDCIRRDVAGLGEWAADVDPELRPYAEGVGVAMPV